jgi:hypothetical protein
MSKIKAKWFMEDCASLAAHKWPGFEAIHACIIALHNGVECRYEVSVFKPMIAGGCQKTFTASSPTKLFNLIKKSTWWKNG